MKFRIERMTESEYRNLKIDYGFYSTPVGEILVASTSRGICCIELADNRDEALQLCNCFARDLQNLFKGCVIRNITTWLYAFSVKMNVCLPMKLFYIFMGQTFRFKFGELYWKYRSERLLLTVI